MQLDFRYRHFKSEVIMMAMRWYLSYSLSYREVEELLLERGVKVDHSGSSPKSAVNSGLQTGLC